jgi:uncharacterized protein YbaP (TraB family)
MSAFGARRLNSVWKKGDVDGIWRIASGMLNDIQSISDRVITRRNNNWIPKIDRLLQSNETYFVVVGAGHLGGLDGLLALLRQRGYKVEQL